MSITRGLLLTAAVIFAFQPSASAQAVSDQIQILLNGSSLATGSAPEGAENPFNQTFTVPTFLPSGGTGFAFLFEPSGPRLTLSDGIAVTVNPSNTSTQTVQIQAFSDAETPLDSRTVCGSNGCPFISGIPETGEFQDVTSLVLGSGEVNPLTGSGLTIRVQSDVESGTVPEPGTLALLGPGLTGLVAVVLRRRSH